MALNILLGSDQDSDHRSDVGFEKNSAGITAVSNYLIVCPIIIWPLPETEAAGRMNRRQANESLTEVLEGDVVGPT